MTPILLVDDEPRNLLALEAILDDPRYQLVHASSGDQALRVLLDRDFAAILLDVQMPEVDGLELARLIRGSKRFRRVPIVFLTAHHYDEALVTEAYRAGAADFITKPIDPEILRYKIAVFADLFEKTRALAEVTEQLETRVNERTADLQAANRLNELFVGFVGHDLRNPLAAIMAGAQLVQVRGADPAVAGPLQRIVSSADRMARMIDQLLDVTRVRIGGGIPYDPATTDLATVTHQVVDELHDAHPDRQIVIHERGNLVGMWDSDRLAQVLSNLVSNAIRHGAAASPVTIELDGTDAAHALAKISNEGEIPSALLPMIFEPFRGSQHKRDRSQGLGLGLYISAEIARVHGGTLEVTSAANRTTFTLRLPRVSDR